MRQPPQGRDWPSRLSPIGPLKAILCMSPQGNSSPVGAFPIGHLLAHLQLWFECTAVPRMPSVLQACVTSHLIGCLQPQHHLWRKRCARANQPFRGLAQGITTQHGASPHRASPHCTGHHQRAWGITTQLRASPDTMHPLLPVHSA